MMPSRSCSGDCDAVRRPPNETRCGFSNGERPPTSVLPGPWTLVVSTGACAVSDAAAPTTPAVPAASAWRREIP